MVFEEIVSELATLQNLALIFLLIALFITGYKLMQTVIETGLIAVLSGAFIIVLDMIGIGPQVTLSRVLTFIALGTGLYILYSSISFISSVVSFVWRTLKKIFLLISKPFRGGKGKKKDKDEKEVILSELKDD
ncbi:MAG: hypothetical protein SVV03_00735 [Candidatus Nanohaloarchaea archaeon]|nr:hypothetical protein [Candidatus Nanohaloarchaea archaeon]